MPERFIDDCIDERREPATASEPPGTFTESGPKGRFCQPRAQPWDLNRPIESALKGPFTVAFCRTTLSGPTNPCDDDPRAAPWADRTGLSGRNRMAVAVLVLIFAVPTVRAQESASAELLHRVPTGIGLCIVVNDLRGNGDRLLQQSWFKKIEENPLIRAVLQSKEMAEIAKVRGKVETQLGVDLLRIRDDILGDAIVLGHQSTTPGRPEGDRGIVLVKARDVALLTRLIDKLNELQTQNGELKELTPLDHGNVRYYRRVAVKSTHYYVQQGPLLIVASHEELLLAALDRAPAAPAPILDHLQRAKADRALVAVWFDPRTLDGQLEEGRRKRLAADGTVLDGIVKFWKGLDAVVIAVSDPERPEMRFTLLAGADNDARKWMSSNAAPSELWRRFPEKTIVAGAGRVDFGRLVDALRNLVAAKDRENLQEVLTKYVAAATGLDFYREIVPNLGPDVGFAVFRIDDKDPLPAGLVALAVKSELTPPVDRTVFGLLHFVATLGVIEHNKRSPDVIRMRSAQQDAIDVKYLDQPKAFPPGVQPAMALKDGYLVLATSPRALGMFRVGPAPKITGDEIPLLKLSAGESAKMMERHRDVLAADLVAKGRETPESARRIVDGLIAGVRVFDSVQVLQRTSAEASSWAVRLTPAKEADGSGR
jgi:hypothetical protein